MNPTSYKTHSLQDSKQDKTPWSDTGEEGGVENPQKTGEERMHGENEAWFRSYTIPRTFWTDTYHISVPHSPQPHHTTIQHNTNLQTILINNDHQTSWQTPRDCLVWHGRLHWPLFTTTGKNRTLPTGESTARTHSSSATCFFKVSWPTWSLILPKLLLSLGA